MADNTVLPGTGESVADEDIGGNKYQRIKLIDPTVGSTDPIGTSDNPMYVALTDNPDSAATPQVVTATDSLPIKQDYDSDGPLIIAQDSREQFKVAIQGPNIAASSVGISDGIVRDARVNQRNELVTSNGDHVIYQQTVSGTTPAGFANLLGPIPAEGFMSFSVIAVNQIPSNGMCVQFTYDGSTWYSLAMSNATGMTSNSTANYSIATPYVGSIPPCLSIRIATNSTNSTTLAQARFILALSKLPRPDLMLVRHADAQFNDQSTALAAGSTQLAGLGITLPDANKRMRVISADGSVNQRGQPQTYSYGSIYAPFYTSVIATAISRPEAASYKYDQPAALQTNDRGHLHIFSEELRRNQEQEILNQQQQYMQSLDPNWGFELR